MFHTLDYNLAVTSPCRGLRRFSKILVGATLFLIFMGSLVTSSGSGLSVPDWPNSYGHFMFSFPVSQWVGGIFYEHSHRLVASTVGFLTLVMMFWVLKTERRSWMRKLSIFCLAAVVMQGLLGGITVLFFLPTFVSVLHAVLAQTFFILTIVMAYGFSRERYFRERSVEAQGRQPFFKVAVFLTIMVYGQLIMGALMRHTGSGLAVPDFPTMAGSFFPTFNRQMLIWINSWRFDHHLDPVTLSQVVIHLCHRLGALLVLVLSAYLTAATRKSADKIFFYGAIFINFLVLSQLLLGIFTLWSERQLYITSLHVVTGAALLGLCVILTLRSAALKWV